MITTLTPCIGAETETAEGEAEAAVPAEEANGVTAVVTVGAVELITVEAGGEASAAKGATEVAGLDIGAAATFDDEA